MALEAETSSPGIDAGTRIGKVRLTVRDIDRSARFYEELLGLVPEEQADGRLRLAAASGLTPLLELRADANAPARDPRLTGLFHFAILVPTRRALAVSLARLVRGHWSLSGASDHLVSEALYLEDPDGNGIEIYRDRDRSEWRRDQAGQLQMATLPLDVRGLLAELDAAPPDPGTDHTIPAETRIGHIHLQVSELRDIEAFYSGMLGFDVMVRSYPGALFVSAGGYHHHVGLNTWHSGGATSPPLGAVGLDSYDVVFAEQRALDEVLDRVRTAGFALDESPARTGGGVLARDPSGNAVVLTT
jgi:catechol 2,3-dioxygenase